MRIFWSLPAILLVLPLLLTAQPDSAIDSLRLQLAHTPDSNRSSILSTISNTFRTEERYDSSLAYALRALEQARRQRDSFQLRNALRLAALNYGTLGDSLRADAYSREHQTVAIALGCHVDEGFQSTWQNFFPVTDYSHSLEIWQDSTGAATYEQVKLADFGVNTIRQIDPSGIYWMRLRITGAARQAGQYIFGIGEEVTTWGKIDVYYEQEGQLIYQRTGFDCPPGVKAIRDAFSLVEVSLDTSETIWFYCRVEGLSPYREDSHNPCSIFFIDHTQANELGGYRHIKGFSPLVKGANLYKRTRVSQSLEILPDSNNRSFQEILSVWDDQARYNLRRKFRSDCSYWVKLRLIGNPDFYGQQLFNAGMTNQFNWRQITVYVPNRQGEFSLQLTGNDIPIWKKKRWDNRNLFEVNLPQDDTLDVWLHLEEMSRIYPYFLDWYVLFHIDESSWSAFTLMAFFEGGLFYGSMAILMFYFLLLFLTARDVLYLYLSISGLGTILVIMFSGTERIELFGHWNEWRIWISTGTIAISNSISLLVALVFLRLKEQRIRMRRAIPYLVVLIFIAAFQFAYAYDWNNHNPDRSWNAVFYFSVILLLQVYLLAVGIISWRHGYRPAIYYLLALSSTFFGMLIFITLITTPYLGNYGYDMGNQFLKLGIVLTAILFALGIGYRNRLFREEKAAVEIAHREALAAERAATAANEAKSAFLSNVSHELRTPLTAIIGFTKLNKKSLAGRIRPGLKEEDAQAQKATQKLDENLDVVASESERLLNLINDLLDLAKIEAGKVEWKMVEVQAKSLIERSLNATAALFEQKPSLELVRQLPEDLPAVTADQDRIIQVLINLISNAVKFTEEGQITIGVKPDNKSAVPDGTADLLFFVKDTGSGIPDDQIDRVFDRFKQVDDHQSGKPKGTGLGLPICKEIVEHHGGQIWVASTLGKGSTFFFSLPVKR